MRINIIRTLSKFEDRFLDFFKQNYIGESITFKANLREQNFMFDLLGISQSECSMFLFAMKDRDIEKLKQLCDELKPHNGFLLSIKKEKEMENKETKEITNTEILIVTVITAGFSDLVIDCAKTNGETGATTFSAKGIGSNYSSFLDMNLDSEREIILIISSKEKHKKTMNSIKKAIIQSKNAKGLCFTLPISEYKKFNIKK